MHYQFCFDLRQKGKIYSHWIDNLEVQSKISKSRIDNGLLHKFREGKVFICWTSFYFIPRRLKLNVPAIHSSKGELLIISSSPFDE
jgi:hypothetical protein